MFLGGALRWSLYIVWKLDTYRVSSIGGDVGKDGRGRLCSELEEQNGPRPYPDLTHSVRDSAATALVSPAEEWVTHPAGSFRDMFAHSRHSGASS